MLIIKYTGTYSLKIMAICIPNAILCFDVALKSLTLVCLIL